jgi:hypothetical protein
MWDKWKKDHHPRLSQCGTIDTGDCGLDRARMRRSLRLAGRATAAADAVVKAPSGLVVAQSPVAARPASDGGDKKRRRGLHVKREALPLDAQDADAAKQEAVKGPTVKDEPSTDRWVALCSTRELSCALTLASGQVFSWRKTPASGGGDAVEWMGVVGRRVYVLRERDAMVECRCLFPSDGKHDASVRVMEPQQRLIAACCGDNWQCRAATWWRNSRGTSG